MQLQARGGLSNIENFHTIMYFRMTLSDSGDYVDAEGNRYRLAQCNHAATPDGPNIGYAHFATLDVCLSAWGLTYSPLPPPSREESSTDNNGNDQ